MKDGLYEKVKEVTFSNRNLFRRPPVVHVHLERDINMILLVSYLIVIEYSQIKPISGCGAHHIPIQLNFTHPH